MGIFRLYSGEDGESHMEELDLASRPALTALQGAKGVVFRSTPPARLVTGTLRPGGSTSLPCPARQKSAWGMARSTASGPAM
jgi:hypothetical protein